MLTKQDLNLIKKVVRDEVSSEDRAIKSDLKEAITRTRVDSALRIDNLANRVKDLGIQGNEISQNVVILTKNMTEVKKDVKKIDKKFDDLFDFIDKEHMGLVRRVVRIEDNLGIPVAGL